MNRDKKEHVQEWVDKLPPVSPTTPISPSNSTFQYINRKHKQLVRDASVQSDCSHCSSVESVLEFRKPDPEAVLIGLGFGPRNPNNQASRIPERFLQPSQLIKHIDLNKFLEEQGQIQVLDHVVNIQQSPEKQRPKTC